MKIAIDENFNNDIVRGLLRRLPDLDLVRIQDVGLAGVEDPAVLEWAANEGRVLFTHDVNTMVHFGWNRVKNRQPMPGIFVVSLAIPIRVVIEDMLLLAESFEDEWRNQICYLPLM